MNTREKFRYMAFGGALVFLGMLGAMMSPLTAEKDKFGEIECTRLTVVDADGKTRVNLTTDEYGGVVDAYGNDGLSGAALGVNEYGGSVRAFGKDNDAAVLYVDESGGVVSAFGKHGKLGASLSADESGGVVSAFGKDGKSLAALAIRESGGGIVFARSKDGGGASLGVHADGGYVQVDSKGEGRVAIEINKYGDGDITIYDKNGNRQ